MSKEFSEHINRLKSIGFWKYWKLKKCITGGLDFEISKYNNIPSAPPSRHTIIGEFFHDLMEINPLKIDENNVDDVVEKLISEYQLKVDSNDRDKDKTPFGDWAEVNESCNYFYDQFDRIRKSEGNKSTAMVMPEELIFSKTGELKGKPDLIINSGNEIVLIEYKSGQIRDDNGDVKEDFRAQVHFYAYLINEKMGQWPTRVYLKSLVGDECQVSISKDYVNKMVRDARGVLDRIKSEVSDLSSCLDKANPSPINCKYCRLRFICKKFQAVQFSYDDLDGRYGISGRVADVIERGERITLKLEKGVPGDAFVVKNIYRKYLPVLNIIGKQAGLINLRISDQDKCLEGTKETEIWIR